MPSSEFLDLVRLAPAQRQKLLTSLESGPDGEAKRHGRKSSRHPCRGEMTPFLALHPGGNVGAFLVMIRNLSAGGLAIVHGGYLHVGTECRILLATIEGQKTVLPGKVRRCRHIKGSLHEIGLEFSKAIVPEDFVPAELLVATIEDLTPPEEDAAPEAASEEQPVAEEASEATPEASESASAGPSGEQTPDSERQAA